MYPDHTEWTVDEVQQWALRIGIDKEDSNLLTKHKIDGSELSELTQDELMSDGWSRSASKKLTRAISRLWRNITIHGVIFAPADTQNPSESYTVAGGGSILVFRGNGARFYLGGLNQLYQYMV